MANKILSVYKNHDAFLVLHGTDTMAFTASALSFLLQDISKPVIVTGSQLPLFFEPTNTDPNESPQLSILYNTDALRNVLGSVKFGTFSMPEVCLYFDDHLYRGNRVVKSNASEFTAFSSPNFPAIGEYGVLPKLNDALLLRQPKNQDIDTWLAETNSNMKVIGDNINKTATLPFLLFPAYYDKTSGNSLLVSVLGNMMNSQPPIKGIVLEAYGEGNVPSYPEMQSLLRSIHQDKKTIIVDCTQVFQGDVNYNAYATGAWLKTCGVISGYDMTAIAAVTKLIVLNALNPLAPISDIESKMVENLSGELTPYYRLSGYQNQFLSPGEGLYSMNGFYQLVNETNGVLNVYDLRPKSLNPPKPSILVWQKDLGQSGRLVMQADCNLVFYNEDFMPLYASDTAQIGTNAYFQLDNDAGLNIYDLYTNALIFKIN